MLFKHLELDFDAKFPLLRLLLFLSDLKSTIDSYYDKNINSISVKKQILPLSFLCVT